MLLLVCLHACCATLIFSCSVCVFVRWALCSVVYLQVSLVFDLCVFLPVLLFTSLFCRCGLCLAGCLFARLFCMCLIALLFCSSRC